MFKERITEVGQQLSNNNLYWCVWQHLIKDQESSTQEMKEEIDASRRKADLEDHVVQRLMETDREEKQKAQMVR